MASLFNSKKYFKEGPGVNKNEPQKNSFIKYFEIFIRKFWQIVTVNMIYCIYLIPIIILSFLLINMTTNYIEPNALIYLLCFAPTILLGPANAGITKVTRDFVREEPGFIWSDFHESLKKNWKQSLLVSCFQYFGLISLFAAGSFYYDLMQNGGLYFIPFFITLFLGYVYIVMLFYLQLMVVTLDLNLKKVFKNSIILTFLSLGSNLLSFLITIIFIIIGGVLLYYSMVSYLGVVFFIIIGLMLYFAWHSYSINYLSYRAIKKHVIDPYYKNHPLETSQGIMEKIKNENNESNESSEDKNDLPEYVYENGRLIHRSIIENEALFEEKKQPPKNN